MTDSTALLLDFDIRPHNEPATDETRLAVQSILEVFAFEQLGDGKSIRGQAEHLASNTASGHDARGAFLDALRVLAARDVGGDSPAEPKSPSPEARQRVRDEVLNDPNLHRDIEEFRDFLESRGAGRLLEGEEEEPGDSPAEETK